MKDNYDHSQLAALVWATFIMMGVAVVLLLVVAIRTGSNTSKIRTIETRMAVSSTQVAK